MIKNIKNSELSTVAAIYISKYPSHIESILELVIEITKREEASKKYETEFQKLVTFERITTAKTMADNLEKVVFRNDKIFYEYFVTSKAHNKKKKERYDAVLEMGGMESDLISGTNISTNLEQLGLSPTRLLKLKKKVKDMDVSFKEKLKTTRNLLGEGSLPYFKQ